MDDETKQLFGILAFMTITFGGIIIGIGLDKYYDHVESMTAIQAGLVQDKDGHWVKDAR
jgi:hypothetical protein